MRVGEEWLPWSTSGHPALEFCNTYAGWGGPGLPGSDWLRSYSTLAVWAGHMDLAEDRLVARLLKQAQQHPDEATAALDEARGFRTNLYACLTDPEDARAFKAVAGLAQDAARTSVFTRGDDGLAHWRLSPAAGLRLPSSPRPTAPRNCSLIHDASRSAPAPARTAAGCSSTRAVGEGGAAWPPAAADVSRPLARSAVRGHVADGDRPLVRVASYGLTGETELQRPVRQGL